MHDKNTIITTMFISFCLTGPFSVIIDYV